MDRQYIDDQHVVARYLADQLSEADREAFELYCRENPGMFREIEAAARFKVGLVRLEETKRLQPAIEARSRALPMRRAAMWGGLVVAAGLLYGAVVSLRVPVMGATVAEVSGRLRPPLPSTEAIELFAMRSESILPKKIELPRTPKAILIRVLRDNESADRYRATLRKASGGEIVGTADDLSPDSLRFVTVFLKSSALEPGDYELSVLPESTSHAADRSEFILRVE